MDEARHLTAIFYAKGMESSGDMTRLMFQSDIPFFTLALPQDTLRAVSMYCRTGLKAVICQLLHPKKPSCRFTIATKTLTLPICTFKSTQTKISKAAHG